jgi:hypothetical protein
MGLPSSPWLVITTTTPNSRPGESSVGATRTRKFEPLSKSWLFPIATIVLLQVRRVILRGASAASSAERSPSPTAGRRTRTPRSGA